MSIGQQVIKGMANSRTGTYDSSSLHHDDVENHYKLPFMRMDSTAIDDGGLTLLNRR